MFKLAEKLNNEDKCFFDEVKNFDRYEKFSPMAIKGIYDFICEDNPEIESIEFDEECRVEDYFFYYYQEISDIKDFNEMFETDYETMRDAIFEHKFECRDNFIPLVLEDKESLVIYKC